MSGIWRMNERVLIREEEGGIFVFQFKEQEVKHRVLHGGPWYYSNSMLLLADYDGLRAPSEVPLHFLEEWVAVTGLRVAMSNERALTRIGNLMGTFVRVDQVALQRKEATQRIRLIFDVRHRVWARRTVCFTPEVSVALEFRFEKCRGICKGCGFFTHGGGKCDQKLVKEAAVKEPSLVL
ncbi:uncharacterized protein LOC112177789 [Rosa chinensis]|uniref:uncharacterized protein LOC112177789 n=1 Tax=Rosa chinensis TaxID=74649 RepID=UPI000D0889E7|nr:uncharacterized protein LOC112177789 [Rosa chinensis]